MRHDNEISAHSRKGRQDSFPQRPAGDEAGEHNPDGDHHRQAEQETAQQPTSDVLSAEPHQQEARAMAFRHEWNRYLQVDAAWRVRRGRVVE
jgi:hypothetical protein